MTNLNVEHGAIRELNADEMEFVTGGTLAAIAGAIKLASAIADATGGPINFSKLCEWARQQQG